MDFAQYHPAINLIYFVSVLCGAISFRQPVFLAISYISAFAYSLRRNGKRALVFNLCLLPCILAFALYYGAYHHFGITVLGQNFIGNSMTLESFLYGLSMGVTIAAVLMWLSCLFSVFTADKVVYLFGKVSPKLSLFLSISLRTVPRLKQQAKKTAAARKAIGKGTNQGGLFARLKHCFSLLSILITWLLESMASASDSMRSRGYSLKGRTAFSIYRFDNRDRSMVVGVFACLTLTMMAVLLRQTAMGFDPKIMLQPVTALSYVFYAGYALLCLLPLMMELITQYRFQKLRQSI